MLRFFGLMMIRRQADLYMPWLAAAATAVLCATYRVRVRGFCLFMKTPAFLPLVGRELHFY